MTHSPKKSAVVPFERRNFPQEIIRRLEQIVAISGVSRNKTFESFVYLSEATLKALPDQVRAAGATGHLAPDPPEIAEVFSRVRSHYDGSWLTPDRVQRVWQRFGEAFTLLLEATAPGLWGEPNSLNIAGPLSGPDILGFIYQTWVGADVKRGEIYTPWPASRLLSAVTLGSNTERLVYDRLKEALCHPDNVLGAATLLAGLALPENEPEAIRDYFINRVVPAAINFYSPVTICDPCLGSGLLHLATACIMPSWMVKNALITFAGQDISRLAIAMFETTARLYGLNGYALQLEAAMIEAMQSRQQRVEPPAALLAPRQAIQTVYRHGHAQPPVNDTASLSFEQLFRAAAKRSAAEVVSG
jgi:hypothetical protein